jgi:FMN phosphatase YigB (HAD superfamily)
LFSGSSSTGDSDNGIKGDSTNQNTNVGPNPIRVITFDLDNTLWKTGPTIAAANEELAKFLDAKNIVQPQRVEVIMGELWERSKATYAPIAGENAKSPVLLTQLRTDALEFLLLQHNGYHLDDAKTVAEESFDVWARARHDAIPSHLAESVVETLQRLRQITCSLTGQPVLIGAITDGNSDPRNVPQLAEYFDFCVNAECVGISKPARQVYLAAVREAATHHGVVRDLFQSFQPAIPDDLLEELVGSWWVHIGDDFIKDVVAAKELGMRSVWCRELIAKPVEEPKVETEPNTTVEDFVKKISGMKDITMTIGAMDYLANSMQQEFADSVIDTFASLHEVLHSWHDESSSMSVPEPIAVVGTEVEICEDEIIGIVSSPSQSASSQPAGPSAEKTKFCMSCGTKLPITAKFCSSCGEPMPHM